MAFFTKLVTGGLLAGGLVTYYRIDVARTTNDIRTELDRLSKQLVDGAKVVSKRPEVPLGPQEIPSRVGLQESIKARWNETVEGAVITLRTTDYAAVAASTFQTLKNALARTPSPAAAAPEAAPATASVVRQV